MQYKMIAGRGDSTKIGGFDLQNIETLGGDPRLPCFHKKQYERCYLRDLLNKIHQYNGWGAECFLSTTWGPFQNMRWLPMNDHMENGVMRLLCKSPTHSIITGVHSTCDRFVHKWQTKQDVPQTKQKSAIMPDVTYSPETSLLFTRGWRLCAFVWLAFAKTDSGRSITQSIYRTDINSYNTYGRGQRQLTVEIFNMTKLCKQKITIILNTLHFFFFQIQFLHQWHKTYRTHDAVIILTISIIQNIEESIAWQLVGLLEANVRVEERQTQSVRFSEFSAGLVLIWIQVSFHRWVL